MELWGYISIRIAKGFLSRRVLHHFVVFILELLQYLQYRPEIKKRKIEVCSVFRHVRILSVQDATCIFTCLISTYEAFHNLVI